MGDHMITDEQVDKLLNILRSDAATIDAKVQQVNAIKSGIKQQNVHVTCVLPLFEALRSASAAQHAALVNAGFTALNHLLTRLSRQEPKVLTKEAARTLPLLVEKLGDAKEKFRSLALQALVTLYKVAPLDVERSVRNIAMVGKNSRAKEASMQWLLQMHQENGLQFRSYTPTLMDLLEDADGMVRDAAKFTVIELFRNAPNAAKSDLKRQLKNFKVRPAIEQAIVKELAPAVSAAPSQHDTVDEPAPARSAFAASSSSVSNERPVTPLPEKADQVEPMYVNTQRELDEIFREMHLHFEGKETEQNWLKREESMTKLRRLLAGNASSDFHDAFLAGLRSLLDGIIKAVKSLRTSLSKEGCSLVQDAARMYGPGMEPMVEILLQNFIALSASTKKITSQLANATVDTIIGKVTYTTRIMNHILAASQDKNMQPRIFATGWLKTLLNKEARHKNHVEHSGGLDMIEKCLMKGLTDANPGVREKMRSTYWLFAGTWPARAEAMMDKLEPTAQKLLKNDPSNPNSPKRNGVAVRARPGQGFSKSTMGSSKPSLRETMLAQKKAMAGGRNFPARPGSAMSCFSPVRTVSGSSNASVASSATMTNLRTRAEGGLASGRGGLSVAPMRPAKRRPEMAARPATAGPYSVRHHDGPSAEQASSPESVRSKAVTPRAFAASPKRAFPRTRPGHASSTSEHSLPTPSRLAASQSGTPPSVKRSPAKTRTPAVPLDAGSPLKAPEDLTMVVPSMAKLQPSPMSETTLIARPSWCKIEASKPESNLPTSPSRSKVFEEDKSPSPEVIGPMLEDKLINEDAVHTMSPAVANGDSSNLTPEKAKQHARLIDSGISKIQQRSLDFHGFRKLQGILRDNKVVLTDGKFEALLTGLFEYLESTLTEMAPEKVQDVRVQMLSTIKLLLRRSRDDFAPHVSRGLESLLRARAGCEARTHIVSGLELLANELATLGDAPEIILVLSRMLGAMKLDTEGCRSLSMGLHVLKELVETRTSLAPGETELVSLGNLASRCLESVDSGVRMDAVQLCVALHSRVGEVRFWETMKSVKDDPKSLITYYIVKQQREREVMQPAPVPV